MKDKNIKILNKKNIKFLVVHCSDTNDREDLDALDIHNMHLSFGWEGIGYHKIIKRNGVVENGRPEFWLGAHTRGINNISLGICLIGRTKFTKKQFNSLEKVLRNWLSKYPKAKIVGHTNAILTEKTCPNFDVLSWRKKIGL